MITEIAEASSQLIHLIDDLLHQTQTRRLDAATSAASDDVQNFKDDLVARRLESVNLRLAGLQHGILVHLTDTESEQLRAVTPMRGLGKIPTSFSMDVVVQDEKDDLPDRGGVAADSHGGVSGDGRGARFRGETKRHAVASGQ